MFGGGRGQARDGRRLQLLDVFQDPPAKLPEEPPPAHLGSHIAIANAHQARLFLNADKGEHTPVTQALGHEPAIARAVVQGVPSTRPPDTRAGEETPQEREEGGFVVEGPQRQDIAFDAHIASARASVAVSTSASRRAKPNDRERAYPA